MEKQLQSHMQQIANLQQQNQQVTHARAAMKAIWKKKRVREMEIAIENDSIRNIQMLNVDFGCFDNLLRQGVNNDGLTTDF